MRFSQQMTLLATGAPLTSAAALASCVPALRPTRLDPSASLRA